MWGQLNSGFSKEYGINVVCLQGARLGGEVNERNTILVKMPELVVGGIWEKAWERDSPNVFSDVTST